MPPDGADATVGEDFLQEQGCRIELDIVPGVGSGGHDSDSNAIG